MNAFTYERFLRWRKLRRLNLLQWCFVVIGTDVPSDQVD